MKTFRIKNIIQFTLIFSLIFYLVLPLGSVFAESTSTSCAITKVGSPAGDKPPLPASCASSGGVNPGPVGGFTYYCQMDHQWNDDVSVWGLDSDQHNCLLNAGCGPTSLSMVLTYFGIPMTPNQVDQVFRERGWRGSCYDGSVYGGAVESDWLKSLGLTYRSGLTSGGKPDLQLLSNFLSEGYLIYGGVFNYPCLGCVTSGTIVEGHVIVIDQVDIPNQRVHVRDPNNCKVTSLENTSWGWVSLSGNTNFPDTSPWPFTTANWNALYAIKKL